MLSVPTIWTAFVVNFLALGLIWAYVMRSYRSFEAARFWTASAFVAAVGAAVSLLRGVIDSLSPLLIGGGLLIFACCLAAMGIRRFYDKPVSWRAHTAVVTLSVAGMAYFLYWDNNMPARIFIYSLGQSIPIAMTLKLLLSRRSGGGRVNPGARLAGYIAILILAAYCVRSVAAMLGIGGRVTLIEFNPLQAALVVLLVFLSMTWNLGFLLMAIDRLRTEAGDLALLDDLTGVANRRHLLQRIAAEGTLAQRTGDVFVILAIDLDGFKAINDRHGHAAGDECLRLFTRLAQSRLRPNDLLARVGGDEFCIVLPATTLREGAMIARHVVEACRASAVINPEMAIGVSIGVAQWHPKIGDEIERLIAAADEALYAAKSQGKNRFAIFNHAPRGLEPALRQSA